MELRVRLRRTGVALCAATALGLSLWGCGRAGPSDPTLISPGQLTVSGPTAGASTPLTAATITWSCLTAGTAGIFSSATGCETATGTVRAQGRVAALAAPGPSGNLSGSVSASTITLTWLAPTSADPATSYVVEAGSSPGAANLASFDTGSAATTLTATAVPSGTYYVRVRARNSTGMSAPSNEIVLTVGGTAPCSGPPGAPSGLTAAATGSSVTLTWNAPIGTCAPTSYVVEAGSSSGASNLANFSTGSTATAFSASGVGAGTYYVRVRAANGSGAGGPSNEVTLIVGGSTPSPTSVRWVGLAPEGIIVVLDPYDQCPAEYDLQLDLTSSGTAVTGTAITRLRRVEAAGPCSDVLGELANWSVINGTVGSGTISFALGSGTFRFSGTLTATRMTGTVFIRESTIYSQTGSFAVTRQ
jgi:predicted phage tail protein